MHAQEHRQGLLKFLMPNTPNMELDHGREVWEKMISKRHANKVSSQKSRIFTIRPPPLRLC